VLIAAVLGWMLALAATANAQTAASGARVELREAFAVAADTPHFPTDVAAQRVALPDDWSASRPGVGGPVWYRVGFDARGVEHSGELFGLYVERVCSTLEVQLNGRRIHLAGRLDGPVTRNCQYPQLVALPAALLNAGRNVLDIKVVGDPLQQVASRQRAGGLSALELGRYNDLAALHTRKHAINVTLPQISSAVLVLLGSFMIIMGGLNRTYSHLAYYGALSVGWAVIGARLWWSNLPLKSYDTELLLVSFMPFVALAGVQFLLRYAGGRKRRRIDALLYAQCAVVPVSLLLAGADDLYVVSTAWYALFGLEALAAMAFYLHATWRRARSRFWPMAGLLGMVASMIGIEMLGQQRLLDDPWLGLSHLLTPIAFVALGMHMMREYGRALQAVEADRQTLEARVREATAQIERSYQQLAELRVEQVTVQERKRIAADLHDDLGAKLLTIVHTSDNDRISTLAREALEEMRLSVRGLTGKPMRLLDALGDWRAEVVSRLEQAGIEGEWAAPGEDLNHTLPARAYVQTTRILREAVNNIIKHSGASRCVVRVALHEGDFQLTIQDNGKGIPMELDGRLDRGHGMASMKHRAKQLQGQCLVESGPGYGTVIRLTLPLERHGAPGGSTASMA
jgi:signal transduction histidine kinase